MKKITRRSFLKVTAAASAAAALAACSSSDSSTTTTSTSTTSTTSDSGTTDEAVSLKWSVWDISSTAHYEMMVDAFIAKNPNVSIELVDLGSTDYSNALAVQLSGGADDLDILTIKDVPGYSNLISLGMLEPFSSRVAEAGIDTDEFGGTVEQMTIDNEFYMLPFITSFYIMYYNKDLFDAVGEPYLPNDMTFAEYDEIARRVTYGSGADKVYGSHYHTWRSTGSLFGILDGEHTIVDGEYDFLQEIYEWVLGEQEDGICMDYATLKTSSTHYSGVFYNQQIASMNMGSWFIATQIAAVASGESLATNWGLAKYPHPEGVEAGTTLGTITSLAVNSKSSNKDVAFDFVNFVSGEEGAAIIAATGNFPSMMSDEALDIITSVDGFPTDDASREALVTTTVYMEMPMHENAADISTALDSAHDNIMTLNCTIEEGIAEMEEEVAKILG